MPKLICQVRNCSHNKEEHCCLDYIEVDGTDATNTKGTSCANFTADQYIASNCSHQMQQDVSIKCGALMCIYNADDACSANEMSISGPATASCSHDTQCISFWSR